MWVRNRVFSLVLLSIFMTVTYLFHHNYIFSLQDILLTVRLTFSNLLFFLDLCECSSIMYLYITWLPAVLRDEIMQLFARIQEDDWFPLMFFLFLFFIYIQLEPITMLNYTLLLHDLWKYISYIGIAHLYYSSSISFVSHTPFP